MGKNDQNKLGKDVITVKDLTMGWPGKILLKDVSFTIHEGEIVFILGGSGCGKSSLMKTIIGLNPPMEGDILVNGESIIHSNDQAKIQRSLGIMYQSGALFGSLSVQENIKFPLDQFTDLPEEAKNLTAQLLLNVLDMPNAGNLMPGEISVGCLKEPVLPERLLWAQKFYYLMSLRPDSIQ